MRYKIFSNDDDTMYVKSLNPIVLASEFEAQSFIELQKFIESQKKENKQ